MKPSLLALAFAALSALTLLVTQAVSAPAAQGASWSQPFAGFVTWTAAESHASSLVEAGFSDWHLPTRNQLVGAIQGGALPPMATPVGTYFCWTSEKKGNKAYAITVTTDANGSVVPSLSGGEVLIQKSSFVCALATRP